MTGRINALSFAAVYVQAVMLGRGEHREERAFPATAFLVGSPHDLVLVTARHVLAGEDPLGNPIDRNGARPDVLRVHLHDALAGDVKARTTIEIDLWEDEDWSAPKFHSHPNGPSVDVAAIRLGYEPGPEHVVALDPRKRLFSADLWSPDLGDLPAEFADGEIPLRVMDRVTILGFPFGDEGTWPTGVWTTGFVASEPLVPYQDGPAFLIDARTRPGLSGAPVIRYLRPADPVTDFDGTVHFHETHQVELLGVYSGRLDERADLGRCVSVAAVLDLIESMPPPSCFEEKE